MAFSELETRRYTKIMEQYIENRRPPVHIRDKLDIGFRIKGQSVEIFEIRPAWREPATKIESGVAKTTYVRTQKFWKVFWMRADLKWHGYDPGKVRTLEEFLIVVDDDEYGCFWG